MIIKNLQKNKGPAQYRRLKSSGSGFVILFAVTISAILLSIALGVSNIALKEIKFGTSVKDTNEAFFAADSGAESVLLKDKNPNAYPPPSLQEGQATSELITVPGLGSKGLSCASVVIRKSVERDINNGLYIKTTVTSKGYNIGDSNCSSSFSRIEREIVVSY